MNGPSDPIDLRDLLTHRDPSQLWFQLAEIVNDRTYLQHGIEVDPGDVVIDVGANVGVAAAFFLTDCQAGEVHSFEPVPAIHEMLVENVKTLPGARTYQFGLSDTASQEDFTYYEGATAMSSRYALPGRDRNMVKTVLLGMGLSEAEADDRLEGDFLPQTVSCELRPLSSVIDAEEIARIDLLKVDVERAELDVLRGINERHWSLVRQVVAEVHDEGDRLGQIRTLLESQGFDVHLGQEENMKRTDVFVLYARRT
ncbi:MAG: FkbM family methyltransferase [Solirubrobacterales bacterium]